MLKNFAFLFSLLLFNNFLFAEELDFEEISNKLNEAANELKEELVSLGESDLDEAVIVDSALNNMLDTIQYLENSVENKNLDQTLATLKFLDENLGNISSVIPSKIYNDMSDINMESFDEEDLLVIKNISDKMNENRDDSFKEMVVNMITLEDQGFNAFSVVDKLNDLGVDVGDITVKLKSADDMKEWTIEEWANSWTGEVATQRVDEMKNEDGTLSYVNLSDQEIVEMKAQMAMNFAKNVGFDTKEFNPNLTTSFDGKIIRFTGIDDVAARKALSTLGKSEADWANSWTGSPATHKSVNGVRIELTAEEIQATEADWAMNRAVQSIVNDKDFDDVVGINVSELRDLASTFNVAHVVEPEYISGFNNEAAMAALEQLNKSEADWAAAWTGEDPTTKTICDGNNGCTVVELTAEEIQSTKAEWAINTATRSLMEGKGFANINIDQSELSQATTLATENMAEQIKNNAAKAAEVATRIANFDTSSVTEELASATQDLVQNSEFIADAVQGGANITDLESLEEYLSIDIEAIVTDTSSWTEADWAAAWTGEDPAPSLICDFSKSSAGECTLQELTAEEMQRTKAEWAQNRAEQAN